MLTGTHIDEFLGAVYEDSDLKSRFLLWAFIALVFPTAALVAWGVPEKPAYVAMCSLLFPLYLGIYLLRKPQMPKKEEEEEEEKEAHVVRAALSDVLAYSSVRFKDVVVSGSGGAVTWGGGLATSIGPKPNPEHLTAILAGVDAWNKWRRCQPEIAVNLMGADLSSANLSLANLKGAFLNGADFRRADLRSADLGGADLVGANLKGANLRSANLSGANMRGADVSGASLTWADLGRADLSDSDLSEADLHRANLLGTILARAKIGYTVFGDNDLSGVKGLESVRHLAPSTIGIDTLYLSKGRIPEAFLRGARVPDDFITYMKSLTANPIEFYSCFISYSFEDQAFADRLYADLQNKGVRCWFAPHDIKAGEKIHEQIDEAIRLHDKLLLILSPHSMESEWVKTEIAKARKREVHDKRRVLFPIRLAPFATLRDWSLFVADTGKDSAREIREYFIPDFSNWKNRDSYQEAFQRLISDLKASDSKPK